MNSCHSGLKYENKFAIANSLIPRNKMYSKVGKWDQEEDKLLTATVSKFGEKNWKAIAKKIPGRSLTQCNHRWTKILRPGLVKGHWVKSEDEMLRQWVSQAGPNRWSECAEFIKGRTGKQCRERWFNTLNPTVLKGNWTIAEDFVIFYVYNSIGSKWAEINKILPKRAENSVKNRFYSTLRAVALECEKSKNRLANQETLKRKYTSKDITEAYFATAYNRKVVNAVEEAERQGEAFNHEEVLSSINKGLKEYLTLSKKKLEPLEEKSETSAKCAQSSEKYIDSLGQSSSVSEFECYFDPQNCFDFDNLSLYKFNEVETEDTSLYQQQLDKRLKQIRAIRETICRKYKGCDQISNNKQFKEDVLNDFFKVKEDLKSMSKSISALME